MPRRPILGRAGAGVLVTIAAFALAIGIQGSANQPIPSHPIASVDSQSVSGRTDSGLRWLSLEQPTQQPMEEVSVIPLGRAAIKVPVLMYHYIRVNPNPRDQLGYNLSVTPDDFRKQMDLLDQRGYHPIDFDDLRGYLTGQAPLPAKPVILTFDDGYADFYTTAFPILRQHLFKAVSYVVPGFLNGPNGNYMTQAQVIEIDHYGIQIGSHTVSHADVTKIAGAALTHELVDSKRALEQMVGHPVVDFCYPSGQFNAAAVQAVQAAGYLTATTTAPGSTHGWSDRYTWSRVRVSGGETITEFATYLGPEEPPAIVQRPISMRTHSGLPRLAEVFPLQPPPPLDWMALGRIQHQLLP